MRKKISRWLAATGLALGVAYAITLGATPTTTYANDDDPPPPTPTIVNGGGGGNSTNGNNPGGSGSGTGGEAVDLVTHGIGDRDVGVLGLVDRLEHPIDLVGLEQHAWRLE